MPTSAKSSVLQTRLSARHKRTIERAAKLRNLSVSDYLRQVLVPMAEREVEGARHGVIEMTAEEQLAFWQAINEPATLTPAQKRLARIMRGED